METDRGGIIHGSKGDKLMKEFARTVRNLLFFVVVFALTLLLAVWFYHQSYEVRGLVCLGIWIAMLVVVIVLPMRKAYKAKKKQEKR